MSNPMPEDKVMWCDLCDEETLHTAMLTALPEAPHDTWWQHECEVCMLSWEWQ